VAKMLNSQKRLLGLVGKVLSSKLQGDKEFSKQLSSLLAEGEFDDSIVVTMRVRGSKAADSTVPRYLGVSHEDLHNYAIGFLPGFTEDNYRRLAAAVIEIRRAQLEDRDVRDVQYVDRLGQTHTLTVNEIREGVARAVERKEKMEADAESPAFSQLIKQNVTLTGRVDIDFVECKVRNANPEELTRMEPLKQTKKDALKHGVIIPPKPRKPRTNKS